MPRLVEAERQKYELAWAVEAYATNSPGEQCVPVFLDMLAAAGHVGRGTVLDAGCGAGKGAIALVRAGFDVTLTDLTPAGLEQTAEAPELGDLSFVPACLWEDLMPVARGVGLEAFDFAYCCDVMEHIPTHLTMLVVARLLDVAGKGVFLSVSMVPDVFGVWVGEPLHQTVQPFVWWRDQLNVVGRVVEARDLLTVSCFLLEPRR
jgi:2-polyprenyl-3-methyl-5-hydroxy-6-metoxy-1,4-benzoquinol methylase